MYTLHVAPWGCDGWAGTPDAPLATLAEARDRLRVIRAAGKLEGPAEVLVHAGVYALAETLAFTPEDLGTAETPVAYRAAGDGEVRLLGGATLEGFTPHAGGVMVLDLAAVGLRGLTFRQLFFNGERQPVARYPNADPENPYAGGFLYVEGEIPDMEEDGHGVPDRFTCRDPRLATWSRLSDVELFIFPRYNWCNSIVRLRDYDPATGEVTLASPARYAIYPGDRFYFRNVREELDAPGEWYLDREKDLLYFYPPASLAGAVVSVPRMREVIRVSGDGDPARGYLTLHGFTVEGADGDGIRVEQASHVAVLGCVVRNTGGTGITVAGGRENLVEGCDVYATGAGGIACEGGERAPFFARFTPCDSVVCNNYVHHVGAEHKSVAGVRYGGVGVTVSHNYIHDSPRWGIAGSGNDHVIEFNHIRHVNTETSDTAAIYTCARDWTQHGTVVRYNRIHDVLGYSRQDGVWRSPAYAFGIYLDDWTSGVHVYGNLTYRTPWGGMFIHAGQDNLVENNCFLEARDHLALFRRWEAEKEYRHMGTHGLGLRRNTFRRNIVAGGGPAAHVYCFENCLDEHGDPEVAGNRWEENLLWRYDRPITVQRGLKGDGMSWEAWLALGHDTGSRIADPRFVDPDRDDFHLQPDSPALDMGFQPLPLDAIGPYPHPNRSTWPIQDAPGAREHPLVTGEE